MMKTNFNNMTKKEIKSIFLNLRSRSQSLKKREKRISYLLLSLVILTTLSIVQLYNFSGASVYQEKTMMSLLGLALVNFFFFLILFIEYLLLKKNHNRKVETTYNNLLSFPAPTPGLPNHVAEYLVGYLNVEAFSAEEKEALLRAIKDFKR